MSARFPSRVRAMIALAAMVLTAAGCGGESDLSLVPVEGSVTYRQTPLTSGNVVSERYSKEDQTPLRFEAKESS
ncbi:MAG: hypothetical protein HQ581_07015, partial [Planctomycetes bacterium]|nr:hypothetical protein [Planctomycetota bacterium]